ncbi:MAG: hypothetical protein JHC26_11510 [Thermofilum sp.]|uniref:hypothetical protein n=1 Tax=Thermofilum sp. TaxID=1961369 RepID=UPI002589C1EF|nr:hypothetical protein [Thermofilum sp.]MCI4409709.1 hypothetical protein [Thermofilum sp.]
MGRSVRRFLMDELPWLKRYAKMMNHVSSNLDIIDDLLSKRCMRMPKVPIRDEPVAREFVGKRLILPDWVSMFVYGLPYVHIENINIDPYSISITLKVPAGAYESMEITRTISTSLDVNLRSILTLSTLGDDLTATISELAKKISADTYENLETIYKVGNILIDRLELDSSINVDPSTFSEPLTEYDLKNIRAISAFIERALESSRGAPYEIDYGGPTFRFPYKGASDIYSLLLFGKKTVNRGVEVPDWVTELTHTRVDYLSSVSLNHSHISLEASDDSREPGIIREITYIRDGWTFIGNLMLAHFLLNSTTRKWIDRTLYKYIVLTERVKEKIKELASITNMFD